jgi:hypothetical protein
VTPPPAATRTGNMQSRVHLLATCIVLTGWSCCLTAIVPSWRTTRATTRTMAPATLTCAGERERRAASAGRRARKAPSHGDPSRSRPRRMTKCDARHRRIQHLHCTWTASSICRRHKMKVEPKFVCFGWWFSPFFASNYCQLFGLLCNNFHVNSMIQT